MCLTSSVELSRVLLNFRFGVCLSTGSLAYRVEDLQHSLANPASSGLEHAHLAAIWCSFIRGANLIKLLKLNCQYLTNTRRND